MVSNLLEKEFLKFIDKLSEDPLRNISVLIISGYFMFAFAQYFYQYFSILTLITYVSFCLKGITKIIDSPKRTVIWAVGFVLGATAIKMIFEYLIPTITFKSIVSIISVLVMGYFIFALYFEAERLKSY